MRYILNTIILSFLFLTSCSNDDSTEVETGPVTVSVALSTKSSAPSKSYNPELINDWWMAFVDAQNREIVKIVERSDINSTDHDSFTIQIKAGTYIIYAFANLFDERFGFIEGNRLPDNIDEAVWSGVPELGKDVPMTGKVKVDIKQQASRNIVVEVVRLVAKMQLDITNSTGSEAHIGNVALLPAKSDAEFLFPDYTGLGDVPTLPADAVCSEYVRPIDSTISNGETFSDIFYMLESSAEDHPTRHYIIKMDVERSSGQHVNLSATTDNMQWINRNDYIILPLSIIDFTLSVEVRFYPPIGGYPAVMVDRRNDEYYATFGSSGLFTIIPTVKDGNGATLSSMDYEITSISSTDEDGIFSAAPRLEPTQEIIGELKDNHPGGVASVRLAIKVTDKSGSTSVSYTFSRTIYIILK